MKIRDLNKYVETITGNKSTFSIGDSNEPLFVNLNGSNRSVEFNIRTIASFAGNVQEQIFYEFVQNAYDANAKALMFYSNQDYLIVLNNGDPLYTDVLNSDKTQNRPGQLYEFISKNNSFKQVQKDMLGFYGQGSKLLYKLIIDNGIEKDETQLIKAIKEEKKGPYLISWANDVQLQNLLSNPKIWEASDPQSEKDNLLFAKIIYGYYPVAPNQHPEFLSDIEISNVISTFINLVQPRKNVNLLRKGTAIIIPLGNGKYELMSSKENLDNVEKRLGGFISLLASQQENKSKFIEKIHVLGREIEQLTSDSVSVSFNTQGGEKFNFQFAFNKEFAKRDYVNLYKYLPITDARYKLGFIVDCSNFEVDSGRQRITDSNKTESQLIKAYELLIENLGRITDKSLFDRIYYSILSSKPFSPDSEEFIKNSFKNIIKPYLTENIRTSQGDFFPTANVRYHKFEFEIPLEKIGITDIKWIDKSIVTDLKALKIEIEEFELKDLFAEADSDLLQKWILNLSKDEYYQFFVDIEKMYEDADNYYNNISDIPLYKTNKSQLVSRNEISSSANVYFYNSNIPLSIYEINLDLEYILYPITFNNDNEIIFSKIILNQELLRQSSSGKEIICQILALISKDSDRFTNKIKSEIHIFQNKNGDYKPFNQLFLNRPDSTVLFDSFIIKGFKSEYLNENWFVNSSTKTWMWLKSNIDEIKELDGWGNDTEKYLIDIKTIYKLFKEEHSKQYVFNEETIDLYISEDGFINDIKPTLISSADRLTSIEYSKLVNFVSDDEIIVPQKYFDLYKVYPFYIQTIRIEDLIEDRSCNSAELEIIFKLDPNILTKFWFEPKGSDYFSYRLGRGEKNYFTIVEYPKIMEILEDNNFHLIPVDIRSICNPEYLREFSLEHNSELLIAVIQAVDAPSALLPIVKSSNSEVKTIYLESLEELHIDEPIDEKNLYWQIIEFAIREESQDLIKNKICYNGAPIPLTMTSENTEIENERYNVTELINEVKEENGIISSFLNNLPNRNYFITNFLDEIYMDIDTIYSKINPDNNYLSKIQLLFCLHYCIYNGFENASLELENDELLNDVLDSILVKSDIFKEITNYFKISGYDPEQQFLVSDSILILEHEKLPALLEAWLTNNANGYILFPELENESSAYIQLRKSILNNIQFGQFSSIEKSANKMRNTIDWLISKELQIVCDSQNYLTLIDLIKILPKFEDINLCFLRISGKFYQHKEQEAIIKYRAILNFVEFENESDCYFLKANFSKNEALAILSANMNDFFEDNLIIDSNDLTLTDFNIGKVTNIEFRTIVNNFAKFEEWQDTIYNKWKSLEESRSITIFTSNESVSTKNSLVIKGTEEVIYDLINNTALCSRDSKSKRIFLKYPNDESDSILKILEKNVTELFVNDLTPFVKLQSLFLDAAMVTQSEFEKHGYCTEDLIQAMKKGTFILNKTKSGNEPQQNTKYNSEIYEQLEKKFSLDLIRELIENGNVEDIKKLLKGWKLTIEDKSETDTKISIVYGLIGELIYERYLTSELLYADTEYENSAKDGIPYYDFHDKKNKRFIDIKTTSATLQDGSSPFFIHKNQKEFMMANPDEIYYVIRISLSDLNLYNSAKKIKDEYEVIVSNPYDSKELIEACNILISEKWNLINKLFLKTIQQYKLSYVKI
jgi:hypothetical protein